MADSALWIGLLILGGLLCLAGTVGQYIRTNELNYWGCSGTCTAAGGVVELLVSSNYLAESGFSDGVTWLFLLLGFVFIAVALRRHGLSWGNSSEKV
ncbi:hypothetical protein [Halogeometricum luteum]|uniref:Uncharacterized protein n=1 Tax=Halogeometricum luteum TaxID=2950537 RepID=A0ABU2FZP3_9EURY|nr:hypothetical protein [Halogeometricum sp. S3BR5-2]MDS0294012.1 hypothetical protein [Halogeometricum sp. S3BR5-2]